MVERFQLSIYIFFDVLQYRHLYGGGAGEEDACRAQTCHDGEGLPAAIEYAIIRMQLYVCIQYTVD